MNNTQQAWMLRKDGKEIPITAHFYTGTSEINELLSLSYFLWCNDIIHSKKYLDMFLNGWTYHALAKSRKLKSRIFVKEEVVDAVIEYLEKQPYSVFPESFAVVLADRFSELLKIRGRGMYISNGFSNMWSIYTMNLPQRKLLWDIMDYGFTPIPTNERLFCYQGSYIIGYLIDVLNQNFLRVSYDESRDIIFKVSEIDHCEWLCEYQHRETERIDKNTFRTYYPQTFNWIHTIHSFVEKHIDIVDTVTIAWDFESARKDNFFLDSQNRPYDKMPIQDFLMRRGSI